MPSARDITLFLAAFFVVGTVRATFLYATDEAISSEAFRALYSNLVKFTLWVVPAFGFAYWVRQLQPVQYLGISVFPTKRQWILCLAVTGLFLYVVIGFGTFIGRKTLSLSGLSRSTTAVGAVFFTISPLIEEILFRGLVIKEFLIFLPSWGANLVTSLRGSPPAVLVMA